MLPSEPSGPALSLSAPGFTVAAAATGSTSGFSWLPPLGRGSALGDGTFDTALSPQVDICELSGASCGAVIAMYTATDGRGSENVRVMGNHYAVNWHTRDFDLSAEKRYRISVRVGPGVLLGFADVQPVDNGKGRKAANGNDAFALVIGRTLPIKFRIETGIVGQVRVTPTTATVPVGGVQQFAATVSDLHGNPLGTAVTWASSNPLVATVNASGVATAVGVGQATITAAAGQVTGSAALTVLGGTFAAVSAGGEHSCALDITGRAYCWGRGAQGQLGTGATETQLTPVPVAGGLTFASISAGDAHTCGLTPTGQAYCWGRGADGRLGTGGTENALTPVAVIGAFSFASIAAGGSHTCGVTTAGQAYCWGSNAFGRLGVGSAIDFSATPAAVAGGLTFASISVKSTHTCAVATTGQAYCWGRGDFGQLGVSGLEEQVTWPTPSPVLGGHTFASISAGGLHTCGVTTAGQAYCWGFGGSGQLGVGAFTPDQRIPVAVAGGLTFTEVSTNLTAGTAHTCGITAGGPSYCWGFGTAGQLGNGTAENQPAPTLVAGEHTFVSISAGNLHTCGVTTTGDAYCWGSNDAGQLGIGSTGNQLTPAPVTTLPLDL